MTLLVSGTSISVTAGAARAMTFPGAAPVGSLAVVAVSTNGGADPTSVTDNATGAGAANTWVKILNIFGHSNTVDATLWASKLTRALTNTTVVTATYAASKASHASVLCAFDDVLAGAVAIDGVQATASGTTASPAAGPSGDPAATRVLSFFMVGSRGNNTTWTPGSGFANIAAIRSASGTGTTARFIGLGYQYIDNPGPVSGSASFTADNWLAAVGSIAVPAVGGATPQLIGGSIRI